jgi:hypothetical protein
MRKYEETVKEVVENKVVEVTCDMCGAVSASREKQKVGGSVYWQQSDSATGKIQSCGGLSVLGIDVLGNGNYVDQADLCYDCGDWLIGQIKQKKITRAEA